MQQVVVMITSAHLLSLRSGFALKTFLKKGCLQMKCNPIGHERREELSFINSVRKYVHREFGNQYDVVDRNVMQNSGFWVNW